MPKVLATALFQSERGRCLRLNISLYDKLTVSSYTRERRPSGVFGFSICYQCTQQIHEKTCEVATAHPMGFGNRIALSGYCRFSARNSRNPSHPVLDYRITRTKEEPPR